jgi:hypothetical protein
MTRIRTRLAIALIAAVIQIQAAAAPLPVQPGDGFFVRAGVISKFIAKYFRSLRWGVISLEDTPAPPKP